MQQTEKHKFNIIETSDPFSPEALNENTRKVEAALDAAQAETQAVRQDVAALAADLGHTYKNCRIAVGSYEGTGQNKTPFVLSFDFCPQAIIFFISRNSGIAVMLRPYGTYNDGSVTSAVWEGNSIVFTGTTQMNADNCQYRYIAFGYDE